MVNQFHGSRQSKYATHEIFPPWFFDINKKKRERGMFFMSYEEKCAEVVKVVLKLARCAQKYSPFSLRNQQHRVNFPAPAHTSTII
jgi:hypothetical protein